MSAAFDVDLEIGHVSGKSLEKAVTDDYDFIVDDHYDEDASGPTRADSSKSTDGEGVPVNHNYRDWTKPEKYDDAIFKSGKGHVENILLFTGLFSIAVTLFIIESYKKPSLDEQTVALLNQLMGISEGTPLGLLPSPDSISLRPCPPSTRASALWFLSLGLNIACAIWAILRWHRYTVLPGQSGEPHRHTPIRAYHFSDIGRLDMEPTVDAIWALLHTSVFLFFIGLVDFLLLINKTVACIVLGYTVPLVLAYIAMTMLLCFFPNSQYFTPSSSGSWKVSQMDNQHPRSQSPFRRPPSGYIGENSLQDDH